MHGPNLDVHAISNVWPAHDLQLVPAAVTCCHTAFHSLIHIDVPSMFHL